MPTCMKTGKRVSSHCGKCDLGPKMNLAMGDGDFHIRNIQDKIDHVHGDPQTHVDGINLRICRIWGIPESKIPRRHKK
jgi:hypothetical protein